jgi:hypothetical protein
MSRAETNSDISKPPRELLQGAQAAGERWAEKVREKTLEESRQVAGGWPGTMSEARHILASQVFPKSHPSYLSELEVAKREELALVLYSSARKWWNDRQERIIERET